MNGAKAVKDIGGDELAKKITIALRNRDLSYTELISLGDDPQHAATVLALLQATGAIEAYCGPIRPSSCMYRLVGRRDDQEI